MKKLITHQTCLTAEILFMDQSEFSVAGAMGNSNALDAVKSVVPFLPASPPVSSRIFFLAPVSLRCERTLSTDQKGTAYSLTGSLKLKQVLPKTGTLYPSNKSHNDQRVRISIKFK